MSNDRPFRFAAQVAQAGTHDDWVRTARRIEDLGYSTLFMPDHFDDQLAPMPALAAAAEATSTLRVGALVFDNDYKHPLVLAKEAATLDLLSDGRLELGLGAGWLRTDYEASGVPYDPPAVRIDRFEEGLAIVKGLLAGGPFSFAGKHYTITEHEGTPHPVQQPVPMLVGAGAKRMLSIAGREADIVSVNFNLRAGEVNAEVAATGTAELTRQKIGWIRDAAGSRFDDIELSVTVFFSTVTDDREGMAAAVGSGFDASAEDMLGTPHVLFGTVDQLVEELQGHREQFGFSYIVIGGGAWEAMAPVVERLAGS